MPKFEIQFRDDRPSETIEASAMQPTENATVFLQASNIQTAEGTAVLPVAIYPHDVVHSIVAVGFGSAGNVLEMGAGG